MTNPPPTPAPQDVAKIIEDIKRFPRNCVCAGNDACAEFARGEQCPSLLALLLLAERAQQAGSEGKDWFISFDQMLTEEQLERIGLSEDRGLTLCITRLADALNDAESALAAAPAPATAPVCVADKSTQEK